MKDTDTITKFAPDKDAAETTPVREPDVKLTPKEEAKESNKLSRAEQMKKFETSLEAHDSGNQPA